MFQWTDDLNTGISVIDDQHKRIADYINQIDLHLLNQQVDGVQSALIGLVDYTITHFEFEEDVLKESGYPLLSGHAKVHDAFTKRITDHIAKFENGDAHERKRIARAISSELTIWLTNHIKRDDRDYVPYVKQYLEPNKSSIAAKIAKFFGKK